MAQLWCTGPAVIYVGIGPSGTPIEWGTCQVPPDINVDPHVVPVRNDIKGQASGFDFQHQGQSGQVVVRMGRWNEPTFIAMETIPNPFLSARGANVFGDIGMFYIQESAAVGLWVLFPYSPANPGGKGAMGGMVPGYHFFAAWPAHIGKHPGTRDYTGDVVLQCEEVYVPQTRGLILYDSNMTGLPAPT